MELEITELVLEVNEKLSLSYGAKIRGYFANQFKEVLFHQHKEDGKFRYNYPLIQYKVVKDKPFIIGIGKGAKLIVDKFFSIKTIKLENNLYNLNIDDKQLKNYNFNVFVDDNNIYDYEFHSPWIGLSQKNYREYIKLTDEGKKKLLKKILIGNLLSFSSGIDWHIEKQLLIFNLNLKEVAINYKNNRLIAFKGSFKSNIFLPSNIGLGKSVSKGYGRIIRK